ncbi:hypothetical protein [Mesorhizobium qingshengii]|uniref:Uncharacterized protein n=1 Tax=Mesorhizobium qingshengii TaxID=1165689 RepID=A0A1G5V0K9_9HYPH|nr:hypothetical protein [Mesorhizobium qingshengii]SDA39409.1 hypothetical protein SAMN02927914_00143 [Mesorhizobium qingshengii]
MPASEALLAAVSRLDMIELCSRIIMNPERNAPRATVAEVFALAKATEGLWAIALEARLLVSALERSTVISVRADEVAQQMATLRALLTPLSPIPTRQENDHASSN